MSIRKSSSASTDFKLYHRYFIVYSSYLVLLCLNLYDILICILSFSGHSRAIRGQGVSSLQSDGAAGASWHCNRQGIYEFFILVKFFVFIIFVKQKLITNLSFSKFLGNIIHFNFDVLALR